jgi:hypothetical protein
MLCYEYGYTQTFGLYNKAATSFPVDRRAFTYLEVGLRRKLGGE